MHPAKSTDFPSSKKVSPLTNNRHPAKYADFVPGVNPILGIEQSLSYMQMQFRIQKRDLQSADLFLIFYSRTPEIIS